MVAVCVLMAVWLALVPAGKVPVVGAIAGGGASCGVQDCGAEMEGEQRGAAPSFPFQWHTHTRADMVRAGLKSWYGVLLYMLGLWSRAARGVAVAEVCSAAGQSAEGGQKECKESNGGGARRMGSCRFRCACDAGAFAGRICVW